MSATATRRRVRARVEGTVQGVGFRPYVYRLAAELGLSGWVLNDARGVVLEVEGESVERFLERLPAELPPLAHIDRLLPEALAPTGEVGFVIRASPAEGEPRAAVTPDSATCDDCLAELFDPADRRHRYPFVNCTNCGPRFTIVRGVPYDRPLTTMAASRCARPAGPSTRTRRTAASTRSPTRAPTAARPCTSRGQVQRVACNASDLTPSVAPPGCCATARSSR